ncbi:accessory Sec system protein Asp1 [Lactococcus petauri]|jgi:accessory secretory protein Asp1|nr:accessory Sec system protein Asp1 [Lactococcus petauri]
MIVFIPKWENISEAGLSSDDLMGQIKAFMLADDSYRVVIPGYMPSLRYFLHHYDLLECNWLNIFDKIQGVEGREQVKILLSSLNFPKESEYYYTPFHILVYYHQQLIGKIYFGEGAHISEVHHFENSVLEKVEIYDDRGFLSSYKLYNKGEMIYTNYLDCAGESIFKQYPFGHCEVNPHNRKNFKYLKYENIEVLKEEYLESTLEEIEEIDSIIISVSQENLKFLPYSFYRSKMILSFFHERVSNMARVKTMVKSLSLQVKNIIADSKFQKLRLEEIIGENNNIEVITPYDTRFDLSITQELEDEVIYTDTRNLRDEEVQILIQTFLKYIFENQEKGDTLRKFKVFLRVTSEQSINAFSKIMNEVISLLFPELFIMMEQWEKMNDSELDTSCFSEHFEELQRLQNLKQSLEFLTVTSDEKLYTLIHQTRLVIDMSQQPDVFTQISSISAGLPQINRRYTEYVEHKRNGLILSNLSELYSSMEYYLENLTHWQQARVHAVAQIKEYSGKMLREKIQRLVREKNDTKEN